MSTFKRLIPEKDLQILIRKVLAQNEMILRSNIRLLETISMPPVFVSHSTDLSELMRPQAGQIIRDRK